MSVLPDSGLELLRKSEVLVFWVSFDDFGFVLSQCLSTGIRGGAPGSESTMCVHCQYYSVIDTSEDRINLR